MNEQEHEESGLEKIYEVMESESDNLASRWKRLGAALIDGFIALLILIPYFQSTGAWDAAMQGHVDTTPQNNFKDMLIGISLFMILHGYLLFKYGQTIGKKILGIKIVSMDDRLPPFGGLMVKRYVTQWIAASVPGGGLLLLVDVLFIFRSDKRCVHDLIAGTKVVNCEKRI